MACKITKRLREEVNELYEYVTRNERNIKRLKEEYERAVNINKRFTDRIKAMEKEIYDLKRGMYDIYNIPEAYPFDNEESAMDNKTFVIEE